MERVHDLPEPGHPCGRLGRGACRGRKAALQLPAADPQRARQIGHFHPSARPDDSRSGFHHEGVGLDRCLLEAVQKGLIHDPHRVPGPTSRSGQGFGIAQFLRLPKDLQGPPPGSSAHERRHAGTLRRTRGGTARRIGLPDRGTPPAAAGSYNPPRPPRDGSESERPPPTRGRKEGPDTRPAVPGGLPDPAQRRGWTSSTPRRGEGPDGAGAPGSASVHHYGRSPVRTDELPWILIRTATPSTTSKT